MKNTYEFFYDIEALTLFGLHRIADACGKENDHHKKKYSRRYNGFKEKFRRIFCRGLGTPQRVQATKRK